MKRRYMRELNRPGRFDFEKLEDRKMLSGTSGLIHVDLDHSTAIPAITSGDPNGTPPVTPADLIDPNVPESPWAGVVALNPNGNNVCTGTVLSPTVILTAAHCTDFSGDGTVDISLTATEVHFNHQDSEIVYTGVADIINHPDYTGFANPVVNDDLALIILNNPIPDGVPIYQFNQNEWVDPELIYLVGYGRSGDAINGYTIGAGHDDKRVGQNLASGFEFDDEGSGQREVFLHDNDGPDLSTDFLGDGGTLGNDIEVSIGGGDSGGPSFIWNDANNDSQITPDEVTLFGVNTFTGGGGQTGAPFYGSQGGGINVSAYIDWLSEYIPLGEIEVELDNSVIQTGATVNFGVTNAGGTLTRTFTVTNRDDASDLTLNEPIQVPDEFTLTSSFGQTVLAPGESTTFEVRFDSNPIGNYSGELSFENSDSDENPFVLNLVATVAPPIGEADTVLVEGRWKTVFLKNTYIDPVVIAGPATSNEADPVTVRVRNVTADSFQIRVHEWQYLDRSHAFEEVSYVVMESGIHRLTDGTTIIAENTSGISTDFVNIQYDLPFEETPVVLTQTTTVNGGAPVVTRVNAFGQNGFQVKLQEEEAGDQTHTPETVSWLAFVPGDDRLGVLTQLSEVHVNSVDETPVSFPFSSVNFTDAPVFLAGMQSFRGSNTATLRLTGLTNQAATIFVEEEQSRDEETGHGHETIGFLALEEGDIIGRTIIGEAGHIPNVDRAWQTIQLKQSYIDPVVVLSINSINEADPGVVRVNNVTGNSFQVHFEEWNYLNLNHAPELVSYMVFESGIHRLRDGTVIEARNSTTDSDFTEVQFTDDYATIPLVFSQVSSVNGPSTVTTRVQNISTDGFEIKVQEEEASATRRHVDETISWIAIRQASGDVGGVFYEAKMHDQGVNHHGSTVFFTNFFDDPPAVLANMQTFRGDNTATVRQTMISAGRVDLFIEEERSLDNEVGHGLEEVAIFALSTGLIDGYIVDLFDSNEISPPNLFVAPNPVSSSRVSTPYFGSGVDSIQQMLLARRQFNLLQDAAFQQLDGARLMPVNGNDSNVLVTGSSLIENHDDTEAGFRETDHQESGNTEDDISGELNPLTWTSE